MNIIAIVNCLSAPCILCVKYIKRTGYILTILKNHNYVDNSDYY